MRDKNIKKNSNRTKNHILSSQNSNSFMPRLRAIKKKNKKKNKFIYRMINSFLNFNFYVEPFILHFKEQNHSFNHFYIFIEENSMEILFRNKSINQKF